jgi:pimeloyl-ACP methyl ester carboxylesterase
LIVRRLRLRTKNPAAKVAEYWMFMLTVESLLKTFYSSYLYILKSDSLYQRKQGFIHHADYDLEYFIFGSGPRTLIAFHGFNNNAHDFESLGRIAGNIYTTISINIFFHGGSHVQDRMITNGFSIENLRQLFLEICNIRITEKYTLLGYSLGGRICMKLFELFPEKTEKIILLAPDGIKISPFYSFFAKTPMGRSMLKNAVYKPGVFNAVADFLRKVRIVSEKKYQFAKNNFENKGRRERVYQVWLTLRNVQSDMKIIRQLLKQYNIKMHLFFGKYDKIIPPELGINFRKGMEDQISLHILEEGHRLIRPEVLQKVINLTEI